MQAHASSAKKEKTKNYKYELMAMGVGGRGLGRGSSHPIGQTPILFGKSYDLQLQKLKVLLHKEYGRVKYYSPRKSANVANYSKMLQ